MVLHIIYSEKFELLNAAHKSPGNVKALSQDERKVLRAVINSFKNQQREGHNSVAVKRVSKNATVDKIIAKLNDQKELKEDWMPNFLKCLGNKLKLRISTASLQRGLKFSAYDKGVMAQALSEIRQSSPR